MADRRQRWGVLYVILSSVLFDTLANANVLMGMGLSILRFTTHMIGAAGGVGVGSIFSWLAGLHEMQL